MKIASRTSKNHEVFELQIDKQDVIKSLNSHSLWETL